MQSHPNLWIALAWTIALAIVALLALKDVVVRIHQRAKRNAAKWRADPDNRAQRSRYSFALRDGSDRETKLPPIL